MTLEEKNAADIAALSIIVTKVATIQENAERRYADDKNVMREVADGIKELNARVADFSSVKERVMQHETDIRTQGHDIRTIFNQLQLLPMLKEYIMENKEKIAVNSTRIEQLTEDKNKREGGIVAYKTSGKIFWAVCGAGILAVVGALGMMALERIWGFEIERHPKQEIEK